MERVVKFINLPFRHHLVIGFVIRLALIVYGDFHDKLYDVPYTDVDYKVFTDAARHVLGGRSPYRRHTYRYSPVLAYLMLPNVVVGKNFGKILFSIFDVLVTVAVKILVQHQSAASSKRTVSRIPVYCALFWLYNPMSVAISTRGNADSMPCFLIILSLLYLQTDIVAGFLKYVLSGVLLGISIHLRLYPLAFSFPMYLSLGNYKISRRTGIKEGMYSLLPNTSQIVLAASCVLTLAGLTCGMYALYGYEFLFETYIYHLFRKDTRHNFSVLFYHSYLTMDQLSFDIVKTLCQAAAGALLALLGAAFGSEGRSLGFALFAQAAVLVAYNSVLTSQYFVWFLSLLPLAAADVRLARGRALLLAALWVAAQAAWLFYAYLLEFKCRQVFILIWLKSVIFFCANVFVLGQLIKSYTPGYNFGQSVAVCPKSE